jgi:SAM-dependent methyltransferase
MLANLKTRWRHWDWHGARLFNLRSPSSRPELVRRIVEEFVLPAGPSARILDIGGTRQGFVAHLGAEHRHLGDRTFLVNPRGGAEIAYRDISDIPADAAPFDLAMMFGVMVYLDECRLTAMLRGIHGLLRPGGALIVADPNGGMCVNHLERPIKPFFGLPSDMYTEVDTFRHLRAAGYVRCRRRPDLGGSSRYLTVVGYKQGAKRAAG